MKKALKVFLIILAVLIVVLGGFYLLISHDFKDDVVEVAAVNTMETERNPYIVPTGETMISAHRSGGGIAPENTVVVADGIAKVNGVGGVFL